MGGLTLLSTDRFLVTGEYAREYTRSGKKKRFRMEFSNYYHAMGINLYRGKVWLLRDGKRILLKDVWN